MAPPSTASSAAARPRASGRRAEGDARLRQRLESRGASETSVANALADVPDEIQRMHDALSAKFKTPAPTDRARAGRFLLSRGFDEDAVDGAIHRFFGEAATQDVDTD